jgi:hypothetical protein
MDEVKETRVQPNRASGGRRVVLVALLAVALGLPVWGGWADGSAAAQGGCQTPFLVFTNPDDPGTVVQNGPFRMISDSGLLGDYRGGGRFAGYSISGTQDAVVNDATGTANVVGFFTATSPDGASSIDVTFTGQVDFTAGVARGFFTASGETGNDVGYTAHGTIEGTVVGPATLEGADIGLC